MAEVVQAQELTPEEKHARQTAGLIPWQPGQSGNPRGRAPAVNTMINALLTKAVADGKVDSAINEYFELMLYAKDARLRFDVLRDFLDRMGLKPSVEPKVAAQIVNVVRANSPDLNL